MRIKHLELRSVRLTISMDDLLAEKIKSNILYRTLIRPVLQYLDNRKKNLRNKENQVTRGETFRKTPQRTAIEMTPEQEALHEQVAKTKWYHSIDLGHGVITPGLYDHQPVLPHYHLPETLKDMRVLDVATYDGFWAFEFEKRGAAEVVAMDIRTWNDIDIPPLIRAVAPKEKLDKETGSGFNIAKEILGSKVQRGIMNVYDLTPEWMGTFDMVFCSDLLLHLMNPMKALQNIRSVVSGTAYIIDVFSPEFGEDDTNAILRYKGGTGRMVWWHFGLGSLEKMIKDAGFREVELINKFEFSTREQNKQFYHAVFKACP